MLLTRIWKFTFQVFLILLVASSLVIFFNQKSIQDHLPNRYFPEIVGNFFETVTSRGPLAWVRKWFHVDPGSVQVNTREKMITYKLDILSKSLNNYFRSILEETDEFIIRQKIHHLLVNSTYLMDTSSIKDKFTTYLRENLDVLEISLYHPHGERLSTFKYKRVQPYLLSPKVFKRLETHDNILLRNNQSKNLVLVSTIRRNGKSIGIISQTIDVVFFTKILDFLNINNQLFYIKNPDEELIVDNYAAYQYLHDKELSFPYLFYKKLTSPREMNLMINVDDVHYSLGVIIHENNMAGHIAAFLTLIFFIYLGMIIAGLIRRHAYVFLSYVKGSPDPSPRLQWKWGRSFGQWLRQKINSSPLLSMKGQAPFRQERDEEKRETVFSMEEEIRREISEVKQNRRPLKFMNLSRPEREGSPVDLKSFEGEGDSKETPRRNSGNNDEIYADSFISSPQ